MNRSATSGSSSDEKILEAAREVYFRVAAELTPLDPGKRPSRQEPADLNSLPLVHRLFPDAKIILALRHPCDAVFSCFASNFKLNDGMSSFLHLDTAGDLYDISFSYFEKARELFDLPVHAVKYENIVEDRERELKALIAFLGLDWSEQVLDHEIDRAKPRPHQDAELSSGRPADLQPVGGPLDQLPQAPRTHPSDARTMDSQVRLHRLT